MLKRKSRLEPTEEDLARGREFGAWFRAACSAAGLTPSALAKRTDISGGYLYNLANDGIKIVDGMTLYKRPSEEVVRTLARELRADLVSGLKAAGYDADPQAPLPGVLSSLPIEMQHNLANIIDHLAEAKALGMSGAKAAGLTVIKEPSVGYLYRQDRPSSASRTRDLPGTYTLTESQLVTLPIKGAAGAVGESFTVTALEDQGRTLTIPRSMIKNHDPERCFIVEVRGDCLTGLHILNGDMAVCVEAQDAHDGQIVVVIDGEDSVLKRYRDDGTSRWLETDEADGSQNEYLIQGQPRIVGVMLGLHREF